MQAKKDIAWGKRNHVVLDVGCGVASFGIPAISAVMGTKRLPFPGRVFDVVHCARCRVVKFCWNWTDCCVLAVTSCGLLLLYTRSCPKMLRYGKNWRDIKSTCILILHIQRVLRIRTIFLVRVLNRYSRGSGLIPQKPSHPPHYPSSCALLQSSAAIPLCTYVFFPCSYSACHCHLTCINQRVMRIKAVAESRLVAWQHHCMGFGRSPGRHQQTHRMLPLFFSATKWTIILEEEQDTKSYSKLQAKQ
ncbi:uncharacterized protein LOC133888333 isoform X2 [Phragmites australis]|uniref:uncharacterized protein LOC133888333 isoform X2 n=1 Tax=Phragmites australis TaxID=29695 RepID=UPI002D7A2D82|nr:uncharacterized protein LOC133888333 isoform X2 [Phragmites australis]